MSVISKVYLESKKYEIIDDNKLLKAGNTFWLIFCRTSELKKPNEFWMISPISDSDEILSLSSLVSPEISLSYWFNSSVTVCFIWLSSNWQILNRNVGKSVLLNFLSIKKS